MSGSYDPNDPAQFKWAEFALVSTWMSVENRSWLEGRSTTDAIWERAETFAGFEAPDNCPCCLNNCAFADHWKNCFKVAVRETMMCKRVGPGKRHKSQAALRNRLCKACSHQINKDLTQRTELPNCITSCIRGLLCGNGEFVAFKAEAKQDENKPLNDTL